MADLTCEPWATLADIPEARVPDTDAVPEVDWEAAATVALQQATDLLYVLSGRRWRGDGCTRTVFAEVVHPWPCDPLVEYRARVVLDRWRRNDYHTFGLRLPDWPVTAVTEVLDPDGVAVPAEERSLLRGQFLYRVTPDTGRLYGWPAGEHEVTYTFGVAPPTGGVQAAAAYAAELARFAVGEDTSLPRRITSITRQDVTMTLLDPGDYLDKGRVGIPAVDAWLSAVNPHGARRRPTVWSPDINRTRITR